MSDAGRVWTGKQIFNIDGRQSEKGQRSSILHEIIEALNYHLELDLKHSVIAQLEAGLFQVLEDNPTLFRERSKK